LIFTAVAVFLSTNPAQAPPAFYLGSHSLSEPFQMLENFYCKSRKFFQNHWNCWSYLLDKQ